MPSIIYHGSVECSSTQRKLRNERCPNKDQVCFRSFCGIVGKEDLQAECSQRAGEMSRVCQPLISQGGEVSLLLFHRELIPGFDLNMTARSRISTLNDICCFIRRDSSLSCPTADSTLRRIFMHLPGVCILLQSFLNDPLNLKGKNGLGVRTPLLVFLHFGYVLVCQCGSLLHLADRIPSDQAVFFEQGKALGNISHMVVQILNRRLQWSQSMFDLLYSYLRLNGKRPVWLTLVMYINSRTD